MFGLILGIMGSMVTEAIVGSIAVASATAVAGTVATVTRINAVAKNAHDKKLLEKVMPMILEELKNYCNPVKIEDFVKDFQEKIFDAYSEYDIYRTIRLMIKAEIIFVQGRFISLEKF